MPPRLPELLAPAGDMTCLQAALDAGADAVYLGLETFNMRRQASRNFTRAGLAEAAARCRARGARLYLTLNSILFEGELAEVDRLVADARPDVDAILVADFAAIDICRRHRVPFHISTQMSCSNSAAARHFRELGASRVVLARECTMEEVAAIARDSGLEVEIFAHGAVCVAVSGRCLLSHDAYGCSGNRGLCLQPCRREYLIKEIREGKGADAEFRVTPHTVLSAKDLCSLPFLDRLVATGAASLKIEGRGRNAEYVKTVVSAYRRALEAVGAGAFTPALAGALTEECARVYHREFHCGLYHGRPGEAQFTDVVENQATRKKLHAGVVMDYFPKAKIVQVRVQDQAISDGDALQIQGPTTGVVDLVAGSLRQDDRKLERAVRGEWVTFPCPAKVRVNDKVFKVVPSILETLPRQGES